MQDANANTSTRMNERGHSIAQLPRRIADRLTRALWRANSCQSIKVGHAVRLIFQALGTSPDNSRPHIAHAFQPRKVNVAQSTHTMSRAHRVVQRSQVAFASRANAIQFIVFSLLCIASVLAAGCSDAAKLPRTEQTINGMTVDLGVIPAELVQGHSIQSGDPKAIHGGTSKNSGSHHVVVALFDATTGARITNASIRAGIGDHYYNHDPNQILEPMQIDGALTYGGFFLMPTAEVWRIHLQIWRPGEKTSTNVEFAYEHPSG